MEFFSALFGRTKPRSKPRRKSTDIQAWSNLRREVVATALRDVIIKHGIPASWLGTEVDVIRSARGDACHVRIVLKHWEPRLLNYAVPLQAALTRRIVLLDATASFWLRPVMWQFRLPEDGSYPAMPDPASWRVAPDAAAAPAKLPVAAAPAPAPAPARPKHEESLLQLFAAGDAAFQGEQAPEFENTRPFMHSGLEQPT